MDEESVEAEITKFHQNLYNMGYSKGLDDGYLRAVVEIRNNLNSMQNAIEGVQGIDPALAILNDEIVPEDVQIFEDEISTVSENTLISEAGFSARISNRIVNDLGCNTLGDLCKCTSNDLMRLTKQLQI